MKMCIRVQTTKPLRLSLLNDVITSYCGDYNGRISSFKQTSDTSAEFSVRQITHTQTDAKIFEEILSDDMLAIQHFDITYQVVKPELRTIERWILSSDEHKFAYELPKSVVDNMLKEHRINIAYHVNEILGEICLPNATNRSALLAALNTLEFETEPLIAMSFKRYWDENNERMRNYNYERFLLTKFTSNLPVTTQESLLHSWLSDIANDYRVWISKEVA